MRQRVRPLLLFKKRNAAMQRVGANTFALANKLGDASWPGGGFGAIADFIVNFLSGTATPEKGIGTYTYSRAGSNETITDNEGVVIPTLDDEIGFHGLQRVHNLVGQSEDITGGWWDTSLVTVNSATQFTVAAGAAGYTGIGNLFSLTNYLSRGDRITVSCMASVPSGTFDMSIWHNDKITTVTLTTTPQRIVLEDVLVDLGASRWVYFAKPPVHDPVEVSYIVTEAQIEVVTGKSNTAPSDYVPTGGNNGMPVSEEKLLNGDFVLDGTYWSQFSTFWTFPDDTALTSLNVASISETSFVPVVGKTYQVSFRTLLNPVGWNLQFAGFSSGFLYGYNTTYTFIVHATTTAAVSIAAGASIGATKSLDWVSVKEIYFPANRDGVRYLPYANGNSVDVNDVVVESQGATIPLTINKGVNSWETSVNIAAASAELDYATDWVSAGTGLTVTQDGTETGQGKMFDLSADSAGYLHQVITISGNTIYSHSFKIEAGDATQSRYRARFTGTAATNIDLVIDWSGGVPSINSNGFDKAVILPTELSGVYDVHITHTDPTAGNTSASCRFFPNIGAGTASMKANLFQLEQKGFVTPHIVTGQSATAQRDYDDLQYDSDNYSDVGWLVAEFWVSQDQIDNAATSEGVIFQLQNAGGGRYINIHMHTTGNLRIESNGGTTDATGITLSGPGKYKVALTWDKAGGDSRYSVDGGAAAEHAPDGTDIPSTADITLFIIGAEDEPKVNHWNGNIVDIRLGTGFLTDDELVSKST